MSKLFNYYEVLTPENGTYFQRDGASLVLPDGREAYGHKVYMNKILKESGYKSVKVVKNIYEVVGDPEGKLDKVSFNGVIGLCEEDNFFIYMSSETAYNNLVGIIKYLESRDAEYVAGDYRDLTKFEIMVKSKSGKFEYIVEFNLKSETFTVYQSYDYESAKLKPSVVMNGELYSEDPVVDTFIDIIDNAELTDVAIAYDGKNMNIADITYLLTSANLIKYSRKKYKLACEFSNGTIIDKLLEFIDSINTTSKKLKYTVTHPSEDVYDVIKVAYLDKVMNAMSDRDYQNSMNIAYYLWASSHWYEE